MNKTTVFIRFDIEGTQKKLHEEAFHVVDALLDAGFFQDAINNHDSDDCGPLHVTAALSGGRIQVEKWAEED